MLHTTFRLLKQHGASCSRYKRGLRLAGGLKKYGADTPIPLSLILEKSGLDDALWALRAVPPEQAAERDRLSRLLSCQYACDVLHIYESRCPGDLRPRQTIETAGLSAVGLADDAELAAARDAARDAARAAESAGAAARTRQAEQFLAMLQEG